ncbi:UNVERIFIED_CONTAM: hypothetical protein Scaly_2050500 [Sesamum calycinum]|uniref:Uncharacterized protein n=1 Tax=Sesamum calycinum TaxID=2727403 RepID=A0AAW2N1Y3_9LAMI
MISYAVEQSYFSSSHDGVPDDGMRRTTLIWNTASFVETLGASRCESKTPTARSLLMSSLGLCTEGFALHGQYGSTYSCWPVIITPYNLPPGMCMSSEYMFLTMVIPSSSNPKRLINVYLEPLIKKLLQLWHVGVRTHDNATNKAFIVWAVLILTVNDLPTYGMASG